jgi:hypothetical protein
MNEFQPGAVTRRLILSTLALFGGGGAWAQPTVAGYPARPV